MTLGREPRRRPTGARRVGQMIPTSSSWLRVGLLLAACSGKTGPSAPAPATGAGSGGSGLPGGNAGGTGSGAVTGGGAGSPSAAPGGTGGATAAASAATIGATIGATLACAQPSLGRPGLRPLTRNEVQSTLADIFPEVSGQWSSALPASQLQGGVFDNDSSNLIGQQFAEGLLDTAQSLATAVTGTALANLLPCSTSTADHACAQSFVSKYGRRLFRRALTPAESARYLGFFDASLAKSDFKTALKWTLIGLIQSPNAIYRSEIGTPNGAKNRQLSPTEIATWLAYTYTGSTPTDDLLTKAESGNLGDPLALARTMLATPAGKQALHRFFEQYVAYTAVGGQVRPNIPSFTGVSADMVNEMRAFIDQVVLQKNGGVTELLTAGTTNPSAALASYYGFPAPASDYVSIARPANRGLGLMSEGAFLATRSGPDSSSPTKRGLFVFYRLLCQPTLTPPPNVPLIGTPQPGVMTTRQRYEQAHAKSGAACGFCHHQFDPIGFGFEHYDEGGRYRDTEAGLPIDASGAVPKDSSTTLFTFNGEEELVNDLVKLDTVHQCFAAHLAAYAFGSPEACLGQDAAPDLAAGKIGIVEAFARLASEPHATTRNLQ